MSKPGAEGTALTPEQIDALPEGTIVRDLDDDGLGKIKKCVYGPHGRKKILWDNGCISVNYGQSRGKLRIATVGEATK